MRIALHALALVAALLLCAAAHADRVTMKDGRVFEGVIQEESRTAVVIETLVANIRTTMTLRRRDIASIEHGVVEALPEPEARPAPAPRERAEPSPRSTARGGATRYIEIPIEGVFGVDVGPQGVRESLEHATRRGVEHIVFRVKSPGGYVWAADEIAEVMREFAPRLHYTAVVEEAISAAIWVVFGCDEIYMTPGSSIGAAVVFSNDTTTGAAQVDAKMNSAIAGKLSSMAEAKGHPGALVRAMVLQEAEAYAVEEEPGSYRIVDERPMHSDAKVTTLADRQQVLTLTAQDAVRYGVARIAASVDEAGELAGHAGWTKHSGFGEAAMRRAREALAATGGKSEAELLLDQLSGHAGVYKLAMQEADRNSPNRINLVYDAGSGLLSPSTRKKWQEQTDLCIAAVDRAQQALAQYEKVQSRLEKLGVEAGSHELNVREIRLQLQNLRQQLWNNRDRAYL